MGFKVEKAFSHVPRVSLGRTPIGAQAERSRLCELLVAMLRPEHSLLPTNPETVGAVWPSLELVLRYTEIMERASCAGGYHALSPVHLVTNGIIKYLPGKTSYVTGHNTQRITTKNNDSISTATQEQDNPEATQL